MTKTFQKARGNRADSAELDGYPDYSEDEDIYNKAREESEIDPEDVYSMKDSFYEEAATENADNIDITGSVMDDDLDVDNEDVENSYYSMSGNDDMEDLI